MTEFIEQLGGVQEALFYIREELIRVQEENQSQKTLIHELKEKLTEHGKLSYEKPSYWIVDGENRDGPYCQRCYDADGKLIRQQGGRNDYWECLECKNTVAGPNARSPSIGASRGLGRA